VCHTDTRARSSRSVQPMSTDRTDLRGGEGLRQKGAAKGERRERPQRVTVVIIQADPYKKPGRGVQQGGGDNKKREGGPKRMTASYREGGNADHKYRRYRIMGKAEEKEELETTSTGMEKTAGGWPKGGEEK